MNIANMTTYPLNGFEIQKLNPDAKIITYDQLDKIFNIDELFNNTNKIIILYLLTSKSSGHWVTLFRNEFGINFFDSYGHKPDYQIDCLTDAQLKDFNEKKSRLLTLLNRDCDYIYYNDFRLQGKDTMTCGCFVSHRLNNAELSDENYISLFKEYVKNPDDFVALYCLKKLKN
jgi:hypothetical protein